VHGSPLARRGVGVEAGHLLHEWIHATLEIESALAFGKHLREQISVTFVTEPGWPPRRGLDDEVLRILSDYRKTVSIVRVGRWPTWGTRHS